MSVPVCDHVLIGGEWVRAAGGTYPVIDPATEEPAGHAPECSVEQVRAAARAARAAFERGPWRTMSGAERAARLAEAAERFKREALCRIVGAVLPPGVLNFVGGQGPEIGEALVLAPEIDMISFTGSSAVGARIQEAVAPRMKRVLLELGGKSPNLVFADADPAQALAGALPPWTFHTGQACIAGTRLLVELSMYDDFAARLVEAGRALRVGDPRAPGTAVGPLVSAAQRARVERYIAQGVAEGATLACGGKRPPHLARGYYVEPTLFTGVRNDMVIAREEIFGPLISAIPFRDEAEAIALANDSDYGLYGYVWTRDPERALRVARALRTGTVQVNGSPLNPDAPFGGYKRSGIGRDGGRWALAAYSELKYIGWTG